MNRNEQLAKIDGWKNVRKGGLNNSGLIGDFRSERFHGNDVPDYCDDLNELFKLAEEISGIFAIERQGDGSSIIEGKLNQHYAYVAKIFSTKHQSIISKDGPSLKDALANAIIEAAK